MKNPLVFSSTLVVRLPQRFTVSSKARDYSPKDEPSLPHHEGKPIKIEVDKSTKQKIKVDRRKNTGIQVTILNTPYPVVTHVQALPYDKLPLAYHNSTYPRVWQCDNILMSGEGYPLLEKGKSYSPSYFKKALRYIQLAGEHLASIDKDDPGWPDSEFVKFKDGYPI